MNILKNSKQEPKVYYCKHITAGVCGYQDETILIGNEALNKMDATFAGKPVYVEHQQVNLEKLQEEADGYVSESFYCKEDGCHWAKFIVVSDKGHDAIAKGWKVSNAYIPEEFSIGGEWHNIPYNREIMSGKYTHLALVPNPRYEEAIVMTPEEFKTYKESKKEQLNQLQNSKQGEKRMFKFFKKEEVKNSDDILNIMHELSDGSVVSVQEMINAVEEKMKEETNKCNEADVLEKVVKVNGEDMKVADLIKTYESSCKNKKNADEEEGMKNGRNNWFVTDDYGRLIGHDLSETRAKILAEEMARKEPKAGWEAMCANADDEEMKDKKNESEEPKKEEEKKDSDDLDKENSLVSIKKITGDVWRPGMPKEGFVVQYGTSAHDMHQEIFKTEEEAKRFAKTKSNSEEEKEDKKNSKDFFDSLKNAEKDFLNNKEEGQVADTMSRKLARGVERYGSK